LAVLTVYYTNAYRKNLSRNLNIVNNTHIGAYDSCHYMLCCKDSKNR